MSRVTVSRNRETLLFLLDVGPSMHNVLPEVEKVCSMLVQKKLIFNKSDEVGVVLFGTEDTKNELTVEVGGYQHVVVLRDTKVVDGDLVGALQQLPRGTVDGDFLDAIIVGMDMLIKKFGETDKKKKRLCLITNALCPIKDPFEGTKEDQVTTISEQMSKHGMRMESIVVRGRLVGDANKRIMDENDLLLNIFSKKTSAKFVYVEGPLSLCGALRTRNISPVTIYRGDLELSSNMMIKVWVYKKTSEEKFPTLKKYSDKAPPTDKFTTHEVKVDYEYKSVEEPSKVVPPEQRIKGYRYGPQVVPIAPSDWDAVKFQPEKGVKLLGFTDASNILRHYYMKDVNVFIAEPGNTRAILAVSALARAMKEKNKVAIVRCVWRNGQGNVVVGVLTPNVSDKDDIPDSFYFNILPFAEDVREYQFPSFSNFPASCQPNEQQQEAADNLVKMLDLAPSGEGEALQSDFTPNPILELLDIHRASSFVLEKTFGTTRPGKTVMQVPWCPLDSLKVVQDQNLLDMTKEFVSKAFHRSSIRLADFLIVTNTDVIHRQRFYRHLELKSKHPDAAVPPLDETFMKITEADPELLSQNKSVIDAFRRSFELKENPKLKKSTKRFLQEKPSGSNEGEGNRDISAPSISSIENTSVLKVEKIGDSTPVQDFETIMSRRDSPEWVAKAIKDMKNKIFDLVEDSFEGDNYPKALECLLALRKGCILEQEPKHFNDFLCHLCKFCQEKNLNSFCEFLASKEVTLISKTEAIDSEVAEDEARSFLVKSEPKPE